MMRVKEESEKFGLKLSFQKTKSIQSRQFMANRWEKSGSSDRFCFFFGSKIMAGGDCSHEIKRYLLLGGKAMTNLGSVLKSKGITLLTQVHVVKVMVFQ